MTHYAFGFGVGGAGWLPLAGDWNSDGACTIGLYDPRTAIYYLRNTFTTGMADVAFGFGAANAGWLPIAGLWSGSTGMPLTAAHGAVQPTADLVPLQTTS